MIELLPPTALQTHFAFSLDMHYNQSVNQSINHASNPEFFSGLKKVKTSICTARIMHQAPLTRIYVTETEPPSRYLGHRPACKQSPGQ